MQVVEKTINKMIHTKELALNSDDYCPKCKGKKSMMINILGNMRKVPVLCKCEKEKYEKQRMIDENTEKIYKLERLREHSLMDECFKSCTFENWKHDKNSQNMYRIGINYCDRWQEMKKKNMGFTFWGPPGTGKTYLSFCIANRLLQNYVPVIAISTINIINRIYDSYKRYGQQGEVQIINSLKNASLLILDDLGAEYTSKAGKEKQIIYSILDARYRDKKPVIVTTNLNLKQLKEKLRGNDRIDRTYDRLLELAPPIEIKGISKRVAEGKEKTQILKTLL
ncbi:MAG: ATP-binding protein [Marinisporobacter sp.]|nr:ATP-binding protein [Marinisporobacter sp.]